MNCILRHCTEKMPVFQIKLLWQQLKRPLILPDVSLGDNTAAIENYL